MGTFTVEIEIGDAIRERWTKLDALVDTGATFTSAPASVLRDLGVEPLRTERFRFAQGEVRELYVGFAWMRLAGKDILTQVIFNEEDTTPLLGAVALENALMGVDPVEQRLIPVDGLVMRAE